MDNAATELVSIFTQRLQDSLSVAVSSFASDLEDPELAPRAIRGPKPRAAAEETARRKPGPKPKAERKTGRTPKTERRNHCRECGQPGKQTKTCGRTPDHPGTYAGTNRQSGAKADDDDEGAAVRAVADRPTRPNKAPVLAPEPPAADRRPRPAASPALRIEPPLITPTKTVDRTKALREIAAAREERAKQARLASMRKPKLEDFPDTHEPGRPPLPDFDAMDEDDDGALDVSDAIRLGSAQL